MCLIIFYKVILVVCRASRSTCGRGADAMPERAQGKQRPEMTAAVATLHNSINAFLTVITQRKYQFVRRNKFNQNLPSSSAAARIPGFVIIIDSYGGGFSHAMLLYLVIQKKGAFLYWVIQTDRLTSI